MPVLNANASLAPAAAGLAPYLYSSRSPVGGHEVYGLYPLVTGDLWSAEENSPQVTAEHRAKAGSGFASSFVFEEILLWCLSNVA